MFITSARWVVKNKPYKKSVTHKKWKQLHQMPAAVLQKNLGCATTQNNNAESEKRDIQQNMVEVQYVIILIF